jgi:hypothetical protein
LSIICQRVFTWFSPKRFLRQRTLSDEAELGVKEKTRRAANTQEPVKEP